MYRAFFAFKNRAPVMRKSHWFPWALLSPKGQGDTKEANAEELVQLKPTASPLNKPTQGQTAKQKYS